MSAAERALEAEIQAKGLNAPRITPDMVDAAILTEQYHVFPGTTTTVCCLTMYNGFTVVGHSACASPENFDEEIGRRIAREEARRQIWALEGYALRHVLFAEQLSKRFGAEDAVDQLRAGYAAAADGA